eukprot:SAG31_NODE_1160_length_9602_cov_20.626434_6_plen_293_part_00
MTTARGSANARADTPESSVRCTTLAMESSAERMGPALRTARSATASVTNDTPGSTARCCSARSCRLHTKEVLRCRMSTGRRAARPRTAAIQAARRTVGTSSAYAKKTGAGAERRLNAAAYHVALNIALRNAAIVAQHLLGAVVVAAVVVAVALAIVQIRVEAAAARVIVPIVGQVAEDNYSKNCNCSGCSGDIQIRAEAVVVLSKVEDSVTICKARNARPLYSIQVNNENYQDRHLSLVLFLSTRHFNRVFVEHWSVKELCQKRELDLKLRCEVFFVLASLVYVLFLQQPRF